MSSPSNIQIKSTTSPGPIDLAKINSAPRTPLPTIERSDPVLPPASLFTFLPDLYVLISRLSDVRNPPPESSTQDHLTQTLSRDSITSLRPITSSESTIETKDLPGHVFGLKRRIAEARLVIESLEDGSATVEEQEMELKLLQARVKAYRNRLQEFGAISEESRTKDVVMQGVED